MLRAAGVLMLIISETTIAGISAAYGVDDASRFARWWQGHGGLIGIRGAADCQLLLQQFGAEFAATGLREDRQMYAFIVARQMMPDMGDMQYLAVMDVLVSPVDDAARLRAIVQISQVLGSD